MQALMDKRFKNRLRARYEKYDVQAGILKNEQHRRAKSSGGTTVDGMKARRKGKRGAISTASLSIALRKRTGINIWTAPFRKKRSPEVRRFVKSFFKFLTAKTQTPDMRKQAEEHLVQALRVPIKKRQYGRHSRVWAKKKGFQRRFFDTGQLYMAIRARIKRIAKPKQ